MPFAAHAGPLEDAKDAYELEDYQTVIKLLQPLAEEGNGRRRKLLGDMYFHGFLP